MLLQCVGEFECMRESAVHVEAVETVELACKFCIILLYLVCMSNLYFMLKL